MKLTVKLSIFLLGVVILVGGALMYVRAENPITPETPETPQATSAPMTSATPMKTVKSEDDTIVFAFEFNADTEGWTADSDLDPLRVIDGVLRSKSTGDTPYLVSAPVDFAGRDVTTIKIRMWASERTQAQLFWRTSDSEFSDAQSYQFDINSRGGWQVYNLDLTSTPGWSDAVINGLRLKPLTSDDGIDFGIDYIHGIDGSAVVIPACGCKTNF